MALIDSDKLVTCLVWSGLVDKATCGELKEAIEQCTVKDLYTKADIEAKFTDLQTEIKELWDSRYDVWLDNQYYIGKSDTLGEVDEVIQQKIDKLKEKESETKGNVD